MINVLENPFYYLDNFHRVLDWIGARYDDLLSDEERGFIGAFPALPQASRALFVRMVMRKGNLFRASKLNYPEIGCARAAARRLAPTGWVETDPILTLDELFDLLSKPEIGAIFALSVPEKSLRKEAQLALLRPRFDAPRAFSAWRGDAGQDDEQAWRIAAKPLCERLRLIFFGNLHQDWTEFVLSDLGLYKYEQVGFSRASRGFGTRRDIEHYLELHECKERFRAGAAPDEVLRGFPDARPENDWLAGRRERLLFQVAQQVEKQQDWERAFELYARCGAPGARARAIRVLEKNRRFGAAYELLARARQCVESDAERQQLLRIEARLRRRLGHVPLAPPKQPSPARLDLVLPMPPVPCRVEGVVREHLARADAPVFYVENALANALFGLLCWRAIFSAIPGAFFHPFQRGPADLRGADFYRRREAQFGSCLDELDSGRYRATILRNLAGKRGIESPFVDWDGLDAGLVGMALACIPAPHLKKWFERILQDIAHNRTGFPDLIQFWPDERRYNMIEVKGPGDRLQDNQLRWLAYCAQHRMPVSVCYLQWSRERAA